MLFKHKVATRVAQSYADPGAAQGKETGEWRSSVTPGLQEEPRVTWQGLQPCPSLRLHGSSRAAKSKGKTTIGQLCCVPGSVLWSPPATGERHFPAFQGDFFSGESQSWWWESKSHWELVLWVCSGDWFRAFLSQNLKPFLQAQIDLVCSSG